MAFKFGDTKNAAQDTGFEPIPAGKYEFQIEDVKIQPYSGSAKINACNRLHIQMRVDLSNGSTRKVWDDIFLDAAHGYSMRKLKNLVDSCGLVIPASAGEKDIADKLLSGIGNAEIYIDTYNGKQSNKVREYIVPEKPQLTEEDLPF